ncbi:MAG: hypothetical protein ACXQTD_07475 [Candidatus Syntropharchaeia archaeon]
MKNNEEKKTAVKVGFSGRSTGMGAYTEHHVWSIRQKRELQPVYTKHSKSGNHWTDYYWLLPGKYIHTWKDISNSGTHWCGYSCLIVMSRQEYEEWYTQEYGEKPDEKQYHKEGWRSESWKGKLPTWVETPCRVCFPTGERIQY